MAKRAGNPVKRDGMNYTATASVDQCKFMVRRLAQIEAPAENRKGQFRAIERVTGLTSRRLKDFYHGTLQQVPDHQAQTLRHAYLMALQRAKEQLREIEREHAEVEAMVSAARHGFGGSGIKIEQTNGGLGDGPPE